MKQIHPEKIINLRERKKKKKKKTEKETKDRKRKKERKEGRKNEMRSKGGSTAKQIFLPPGPNGELFEMIYRTL